MIFFLPHLWAYSKLKRPKKLTNFFQFGYPLIPGSTSEDNHIILNTVDDTGIKAKLAQVSLVREGEEKLLTVAVVDKLNYDMLLGMDYPGIDRKAISRGGGSQTRWYSNDSISDQADSSREKM